MDHTPAIDKYAVRLKKVYSDYIFEMTDEWPPRVSDQYINLALINHKKIIQPDEMDEFAKSTLHGTVDDLYFEKESITLEHLFKPESVLQGGSLHLRRKFLQDSIDQGFHSILEGLPSLTERVEQGNDLLKHILSQLDVTHEILSQPLTMVQNQSMPSLPNEKTLKILLDGAPGVGKTTVCHKACKEWALGRAFTDFKLMVYVPLCEEQVSRATKVEDLFCYGSLDSRKQVADELEDTDGEGVLFLFDGWDELPPQQKGKASFLCRIILRKVLPLCSVIITSRPYASQWLRKPDVTNRNVEILGLTAQQVDECIREKLKNIPKAAESLLEKLAIRSNLKTLCYVPMNLSIILYIYSIRLELPDTLTGVYSLFIINALLRYLQNYDPHMEPIMELRSRDDLPLPVKEMYQALCFLAYNGLLNDKTVFSKAELEECHLKLSTCSNTLGIITANKSFAETGVETKYQFLHLTMQEFLAAEALSSEPVEIQTSFVIDHLDEIRFYKMFYFLFGLSHVENMKDVLHFLFATSINGRNPERFLFLCHMLYEAHKTEFYEAVGQRVLTNFVELPFIDDLSLFDVMVVGKFLAYVCMSIKSVDFYDTDLTRQKLALLTKSIPTDKLMVEINKLHLRTSKSSINEVQPFISHSIFRRTSFLKIDIPASPLLASMFCSSIIMMPNLSSVHLTLRDPYLPDKAAYPSVVTDFLSALQVVFTTLSCNRRIASLRLNAVLSKGPEQFDEECGRALAELLASREVPMSLDFDFSLYNKSFIDTLCNSSNKLKEIRFLERSPCFVASTYEANLGTTGAQSLFTAMGSSTSIELLELKCSKPLFTDPIADDSLQLMLTTNTTLKTLAMENCGMNLTTASALAHSLSCNKTLTELKLVKSHVDLEAVLLSVATNSSTRLQKLVLQNCQLGDKDEHCISILLECSTTLRILDLSNNQLGPATAVGIFAALHDNTTLEELFLSHNLLGAGDDEILSSVFQGSLTNNHTLKKLRLNDTCLPHKVIEAIAFSLAETSGLHVLELQCNGVSLTAVRKLCDALLVNSTLKELYLSEDIITLDSVTVDHLSQMVVTNSTLSSLTMKFRNNATMLKSFVEALHKNTTLVKVVISGLENELLDPINFGRICRNQPTIHK